MRLIAACAAGCFLSVVAADARQGQSPSAPQQPVFRVGVDVTQLDVSVLGKDRKPIRGLTAADFSVTENGKAQAVVGVSEIALAGPDDLPAAWLHLVPSDVETNFLGDRLRDSRLVVIVMDDADVPFDDDVTIDAARAIGRTAVSRLGPLDIASVVYTRAAGLSQDFTADHDKLLQAIDAFQPRPALDVARPPPGGFANEGDMQRHDEANRWSRCEMQRPSVPTLLAVTRGLAGITERRKTVIYISTGEPVTMSASDCISIDARELFSVAERANVNIYAVDPSGLHALEAPFAGFGRNGRPGRGTGSGLQRGGGNLDFLSIVSDNTGGTAVVNTTDFDEGLDRIFEENGSYYLLGYQSTNQDRDGKFRRIDVHVNRPGATVRARRGYYGPTATKPSADTAGRDVATPSDMLRIGLGIAPGLTLRIGLAPFAIADGDPDTRKATVAMTLGLREPAPKAPVDEEMTVIISATKDGGGVAADLAPHRVAFTLAPTSGEIVPHEWSSRLDLPPGRYEIRANAHSKIYDRGASIYGDVEVPDFTKPGVSLSGVVFGMPADGPAQVDDAVATLLPVVPTTERSFAEGQHVTVFVRVYQGGDQALAPVALKTEVLDGRDMSRFETSATLGVDRFGASRAADYRLDLSTVGLQPGPHLLDIQALLAGGNSARRDVPFFVR
jgi:VWFA-related protein